MRDVYSFRLSDKNPREAQAKEVIDEWMKKGYNLRNVLTEALLLLGKREQGLDQLIDIADGLDRLLKLIDRLEGENSIDPTSSPDQSELSSKFIASIKTSVKPGLKVIEKEK